MKCSRRLNNFVLTVFIEQQPTNKNLGCNLCPSFICVNITIKFSNKNLSIPLNTILVKLSLFCTNICIVPSLEKFYVGILCQHKILLEMAQCNFSTLKHITYQIYSCKFTVYNVRNQNGKGTSHRMILQVYSVLNLSTVLP